MSEDLERATMNAFLIRCGFWISLTYLLLYTLIGFFQMSAYSIGFVITYILLHRWTGPSSDHARGTVLMGAATIQLSGICIIFAAPESGTHYYLMLVPILSLFSISPKRRLWWWLFTIASTGLLLWIELKRDVFQPILPYDKAIEATFPMSVLRSDDRTHRRHLQKLYKVVTRTRRDLKNSYDRVQGLLRS